jgi:uncharacterized membrane protein YraQ (UPF0718 family)
VDTRVVIEDMILNFTSILYEAMPFIVLGAIIAGILEEVVPQQFIARLVSGEYKPKNPLLRLIAAAFASFGTFPLLAISMCALLGLIFPMCECGIVPIMRRLLRKGLPLSCCVAYLLAGPIINPIVIASTFVAFVNHDNGIVIASMRLLMGFLIAVTTARLIEGMYRKHGSKLIHESARPTPPKQSISLGLASQPAPEGTTSGESAAAPAAASAAPAAPKRSLRQRLGNISETALHDFVDITMFLVLGAMLATIAQMFIFSPDSIRDLSVSFPILTILTMMVLAVVLCLCSEADAFVAASFTTMAPSGKLAFLVLGPMVDIKLLFLFTRVFAPRLIATMVLAVVVQVFVYCVVLHFVWQAVVSYLIATPSNITSGG